MAIFRGLLPTGNETEQLGNDLLRWMKGWFKDLFVGGVLTDGAVSHAVADLRDALKIKGREVDDATLGDRKAIVYDGASGKHVYAGAIFPGLVVQLGKGAVVCGNDVQVTLHSQENWPDGSMPMFLVTMRSPLNNDQFIVHGNTSGGGDSNLLRHAAVRRQNGTMDFRIKHKEGGSRTIDFACYKVTPE